jgi:3-oxoadipate enol-lactonase
MVLTYLPYYLWTQKSTVPAFLPGTLTPPNAIAPVTQIFKLRAISMGCLEGAGPHDLHSVAERVAKLITGLRPTVLVGHSVGRPFAAFAAAIDLRSEKRNLVRHLLSIAGTRRCRISHRARSSDRGPSLWKAMAERSIIRLIIEQGLQASIGSTA